MNLDALKSFSFPTIAQTYSARDSILYALGLGYGSDPTDPAQLQFVFEDRLKAVPSMVNILAHPGMWVKRPELGIAWRKLLHGQQSFEILRPLPAEGYLVGHYEVTGVEDLGAAKGARLYLSKELRDQDGTALARVKSTYMLRGDGGSGGFGTPEPPPAPLPAGAPDHSVEVETLPQQALIYRLSGDWNPLHADPAIAAAAGFDRPILHGLCSMGLATRALISALTPEAPERLTRLSLRFSRPVLPGDTMRFEIHHTGGDHYGFRALVPARNEVVLSAGQATLS